MPSCQDLARGGPGSIDVIEIDAASHGGVDDARDLREKAFFAPVASTYKVYIIDEAHMVSTQGFNALLKLVEEPPPHLRFIFATTEPDKVLPTIRSRTHHYPFRLIPPRLLSSYLLELCEKEGVTIEPAALPLVVRAGAGSARDTLSVLDQLLGGAGPEGVTHALAAGLLGYTPDSLLDEVVDAFAASDGGTVFRVVDKVIETGQDPRRFAEDLLRRLRDLVILSAVPDAPATGLIDVSEDQAERLVAQASRFGVADLNRAADLLATGLTEMRGATAPRLLLELICARVLLPGADHSTDGIQARLDRMERRMTITGGDQAPQAAPPPAPRVNKRSQPRHQRHHPASPARSAESASPPPAEASLPVAEASPPVSETSLPAAKEPTQPTPGGLSLVDVRRLWPDIVEETKSRRRMTWIHLTQNAQVVGVEGATLTLGFSNAGAKESFVAGGSIEILRQAAIDVVGADWKIEAIVDPGAQAATATDEPRAQPTSPKPEPVSPTGSDASPGLGAGPAEGEAGPPPDWATEASSVREAIRETRPPGTAGVKVDEDAAKADAEARRDDPDEESSGMTGAELLQRELGAEIIEEKKS